MWRFPGGAGDRNTTLRAAYALRPCISCDEREVRQVAGKWEDNE